MALDRAFKMGFAKTFAPAAQQAAQAESTRQSKLQEQIAKQKEKTAKLELEASSRKSLSDFLIAEGKPRLAEVALTNDPTTTIGVMNALKKKDPDQLTLSDKIALSALDKAGINVSGLSKEAVQTKDGVEQPLPDAPKSPTLGGEFDERFPRGVFTPTKATVGGVTFEDIGSEIEVAQAKSDIAVEEARKKDMQKKELESKGIYRQTLGGVSQASEVLKDVFLEGFNNNPELMKSLGINKIEDIPTSGLSGKGFSLLMKALGTVGKNKFVQAYEGTISTELAGEFAKGAGATRLGIVILRAFRKTLPQLGKSSIEEGLINLEESLVKAFRREAATLTDDNGKLLYSSDELPTVISNFRARAKEIVESPWRDAGILDAVNEDEEFLKSQGIDPSKFEIVKE